MVVNLRRLQGHVLSFLDEGATAPVALQRLLGDFVEDEGQAHRQVGIVDLDGAAATHTEEERVPVDAALRADLSWIDRRILAIVREQT